MIGGSWPLHISHESNRKIVEVWLYLLSDKTAASLVHLPRAPVAFAWSALDRFPPAPWTTVHHLWGKSALWGDKRCLSINTGTKKGGYGDIDGSWKLAPPHGAPTCAASTFHGTYLLPLLPRFLLRYSTPLVLLRPFALQLQTLQLQRVCIFISFLS